MGRAVVERVTPTVGRHVSRRAISDLESDLPSSAASLSSSGSLPPLALPARHSPTWHHSVGSVTARHTSPAPIKSSVASSFPNTVASASVGISDQSRVSLSTSRVCEPGRKSGGGWCRSPEVVGAYRLP
jgi:hypothetical protein